MAIEGPAKVLDALPQLTALLNKERQVVFSNRALKEMLGKEELDEILGQRIGELIKCKNADNSTGGCGTCERCTVCGAMTAIIESQILNHASTKECRIHTVGELEDASLDLNVTASPFHFNNLSLTLLSIVDISHQKRRQVFERIFFHDVLNTVSAIKWNLEYLPMAKNKTDSKKVIETVNVISEDLMEEILAQRDLAAAESGDLKMNPSLVNSEEILVQVKAKMEHHSVSNHKKINISQHSTRKEFTTDNVLLKRVLTNMLKNALEATAENEHVTIGSISGSGKIIFWTKNPAVMPRDVRLQVFQRSFSTKGQNRGLGTYSMKLITEKYLDGKIGFTSNETDGTRFYIELPV
jgi:signal transduction histidine kinase